MQRGIAAFRLYGGRILVARAITGAAVIVAAIAVVRTFLSSVVDQQALLFRRGVRIVGANDDGCHAIIRQKYGETVPDGGETQKKYT